MAIDFPQNPTTGDRFTDGNGIVWICEDDTLGDVRWAREGVSGYVAIREFEYVSTGQDTFTGPDRYGNTLKYNTANVKAYLNGALLSLEDYEADDGESVVLDGAAAVDDIIGITAFNNVDIVGPQFEGGTVMYFGQAAAPAGWTQTAEDDRMLRVVAGAGGGVGGTDSPIAAHTHTGPSHNHTTANHTLTIDQIPAHTHAVYHVLVNLDQVASPFNVPTNSGASHNSGSTGGNGAHNHGNTGNSGTGATSSNFTPRYKDIIECTKD